MAHFAEIDKNNIVIRVLVVPDDQEHRGNDFLSKDMGFGGRWIQTSYNSVGNIYYDPETREPTEKPALRKNYAGINFKYDEQLDAFIPPKPLEMPSWTLNTETCLWEPPISYPNDGNEYYWDEESISWIQQQPMI